MSVPLPVDPTPFPSANQVQTPPVQQLPISHPRSEVVIYNLKDKQLAKVTFSLIVNYLGLVD